MLLRNLYPIGFKERTGRPVKTRRDRGSITKNFFQKIRPERLRSSSCTTLSSCIISTCRSLTTGIRLYSYDYRYFFNLFRLIRVQRFIIVLF